MKNEKYLMSAVLVVLVGAFFVGRHFYERNTARQSNLQIAENTKALIRPHSPSIGPTTAPVTLVEFFDPQCEACREFHLAMKDLLREFDGKVRLVLRYKMFHEDSSYAALALEASREQGKYWESLEELFAKQPEWGNHDEPKPERILGYLKDLGLDISMLKKSMEDDEVKGRLTQDELDALQLNVTVTPSLFVNGKPLNESDYESYETLRNAISSQIRGTREIADRP